MSNLTLSLTIEWGMKLHFHLLRSTNIFRISKQQTKNRRSSEHLLTYRRPAGHLSIPLSSSPLQNRNKRLQMTVGLCELGSGFVWQRNQWYQITHLPKLQALKVLNVAGEKIRIHGDTYALKSNTGH